LQLIARVAVGDKSLMRAQKTVYACVLIANRMINCQCCQAFSTLGELDVPAARINANERRRINCTKAHMLLNLRRPRSRLTREQYDGCAPQPLYYIWNYALYRRMYNCNQMYMCCDPSNLRAAIILIDDRTCHAGEWKKANTRAHKFMQRSRVHVSRIFASWVARDASAIYNIYASICLSLH
jgi:hypothetical protein